MRDPAHRGSAPDHDLGSDKDTPGVAMGAGDGCAHVPSPAPGLVKGERGGELAGANGTRRSQHSL